MTKTRSTKKSLLLSCLALLLCFSMLIGTTFAWFTDSVTSNGNIIQTGNLDIELEYSHDGENWKTVKGSSELFDKDALWEPGHTEVVYLKLSNLGSLALRYDLGVNIISETPGINAEGNAFRLSNYIDMAVIGREATDIAFATRQDAVDAAMAQLDGELEMVSRAIVNGYNKSGVMEAGADDIYLAMVVYMPTSVGNDANHNGTDIPEINLGINVFATQAVSENEKDSFGSDYDADAAPVINATYDWYVDGADSGAFTINTASDLAGLANIVNGTATQEAVTGVATYSEETAYVQDTFKGKTVTLADDIDLMNAVWTPIGNSTNKFQGTFDGNNKTISNLYIPGYNSNVGLFGFTTDGEAKNLTVENAIVFGRLNVGVVAGTPYTTKYNNITVKGHVEVSGMSYVGGVGGKNAYANWDNITVDVDDTSFVTANSVENAVSYRSYVGGVIGFMGEGGHTVSNVTSNINVSGTTCDVGGIVGIAHYGNNFENITCSANVEITTALDAVDGEQIGGIAGVWHNSGNVTMNNCKFTGTLTANVAEADLSNNTIVGAPYSKTGSGKLIIDGAVTNTASSKEELSAALANATAGSTIVLTGDKYSGVSFSNVADGVIIDGAGATVVPAEGSDRALTGTVQGVTVKNTTFEGPTGARYTYVNGDVVFENCVFKATSTYAYHTDGGSGTITFNNCKFYGWVSYGSAVTSATFNNCELYGNGKYATVRAWCDTVMNDCYIDHSDAYLDDDYAEGVIASGEATVTMNNCTQVVANADGVKYGLENGGNILMTEDVTLTDMVTVTAPATIDLGGKTVTAESENGMALRINSKVTLKNGIVEAGTNGYAVYVGGKSVAGKLTIESGEYYGDTTAVFARKGEIIIKGGYFEAKPWDDGGDPYRYTINCNDEAYKNGDVKVTVIGGTFFNFDPSNNESEGAGTNYVPEGYKVVAEADGNGNTLYTVVEK